MGKDIFHFLIGITLGYLIMGFIFSDSVLEALIPLSCSYVTLIGFWLTTGHRYKKKEAA